MQLVVGDYKLNGDEAMRNEDKLSVLVDELALLIGNHMDIVEMQHESIEMQRDIIKFYRDRVAELDRVNIDGAMDFAKEMGREAGGGAETSRNVKSRHRKGW